MLARTRVFCQSGHWLSRPETRAHPRDLAVTFASHVGRRVLATRDVGITLVVNESMR